MNITRSLYAKMILVVALISVVVFSVIMILEAFGQRRLFLHQISQSSGLLSEVIFASIEKPMVLGDTQGTAEAFAALGVKSKLVKVHMQGVTGKISYSTDTAATGQSLSALISSQGLRDLADKALKTRIKDSIITPEGGGIYYAQVTSIPNDPRCHHCHGTKNAILGQLTLLNDVSGGMAGLDSQITKSVIISLIGLLVLIGACIWAIRGFILKKITAIQTAAAQVAAGSLDVSIKVPGNCELAALAGYITVMVAKLRDKISLADEHSRQAASQAEAAAQARQLADNAARAAQTAKAEGMLQAAGSLQDVVAVINTASDELVAKIDDSSHGSQGQAQRITETAAAMSQMNSTVIEVAKSAAQAAATSQKAKERAQDGSQVVGQVVEGIARVRHRALDLKNGMGALGQRAQDIGRVLNVISDIADQTNLLALNAAIEAARAGEAGRGFAVVADEVRKLAEKTMSATKEVSEVIESIQEDTKVNIDNVDLAVTAIEEATALARSSGLALGEIVELIDLSSDQARSIATASEEQSSASEEITRSMAEVNTIAAANSQAMEQSQKAVNELSRQAQVLRQLMENLREQGGQRALT